MLSTYKEQFAPDTIARKATTSPDNSCDYDSMPAKAAFFILARQSGSLRGTCLVQTFCLSQGQRKPFGCLDLTASAPTGYNFMHTFIPV